MPTTSARAAYVALGLLLWVYTCNQWSRYSIVFLGGVATPECPARLKDDVCSVEEVPLCPTFHCKSEECKTCQTCLNDASADDHNLKYATCISSTQYGILAGYGYMIVFCLAGLAAGRATDLYNRKNIVVASAAGWAVFTAMQGVSQNFMVMLVSRIGMAFCQAFSSPASLSMIADIFPSTEQAKANGIYTFGIYLGNSLSSLSLVMAQIFGWRDASWVIAFLSLLGSTLVAIFIREPTANHLVRSDLVDLSNNDSSLDQEQSLLSADSLIQPTPANTSAADSMQTNQAVDQMSAGSQSNFREQEEEDLVDAKPHISFRSTIKIITSDRPTLYLFIAAPLRLFGGFAIGTFLPQYFNRRFPDYAREYSTLNAVLLTLAGASSSYLGGVISDKWRQYDPRGAAWVPAIGSSCGYIPFLGVLFANNFYLAMFSLMLEYFVAEGWFGPAISILQGRLPANVRGTSISIYMFVAGLVASLAPSGLGELDDGVSWTNLRFYLAIFVGVSYLGSAVAFLAVGSVIHHPAPIERY